MWCLWCWRVQGAGISFVLVSQRYTLHPLVRPHAVPPLRIAQRGRHLEETDAWGSGRCEDWSRLQTVQPLGWSSWQCKLWSSGICEDASSMRREMMSNSFGFVPPVVESNFWYVHWWLLRHPRRGKGADVYAVVTMPKNYRHKRPKLFNSHLVYTSNSCYLQTMSLPCLTQRRNWEDCFCYRFFSELCVTSVFSFASRTLFMVILPYLWHLMLKVDMWFIKADIDNSGT